MRRVITYGTFDLFHQGHYNILKRAKEQGDYLIVGVTSDSYDIERGKLNVQDDLLTRIQNVKDTGFVDQIILEEYQGQKINDIIKYRVDTLVIGSDWLGKFDYLKNYCEVLYLERTKDISSTQLRESEAAIVTVGIATDDMNDNHIVEEIRYLSGLHVGGVYAADEVLAQQFLEHYELGFSTSDYLRMLSKVDVVYVSCCLETRYLLVKEAIEAGKWVIVDSPLALDGDLARELFDRALEQEVCIIECMPLAYMRAFTQLVWLLHGGIIGEVLSLKCGVSLDDGSISLLQAQANIALAGIKLIGRDFRLIPESVLRRKTKSKSYQFGLLGFPSSVAMFEVGKNVDIEDEMVIHGTEGNLHIPGRWWNIGYFEAILHGKRSSRKRFSFNSEGNGLRYLLHEMLIMKSEGRLSSTRYFKEDSLAVIDILKVLSSANS